MGVKVMSDGLSVRVLRDDGTDITYDLYASEMRCVFQGPYGTSPRLEVDVLTDVDVKADIVRAFTRVPGTGERKEIRRIEFVDGTAAEYPNAWWANLPAEGCNEPVGEAGGDSGAGMAQERGGT